MSRLNEALKHPAIAAFVGALLPSILSVACVIMTYQYGSVLQNRQAQLEAIVRFDQSSGQIIEVGRKFVAALNDGKDLTEAKQEASTYVGKQILELLGLKRVFITDGPMAEYETAIKDFNITAQATRSAQDVKSWGENFGRVIDTREHLTRSLYKQMGVAPHSPS